MNCDGVLERVARGGWEDDLAVSSHLSVCPQCRVRVASAEALGRHLRDPLLWEEPPVRLREEVVVAVAGESVASHRRPRWWMFGAVAALAMAVLVVLGMTDRPDWSMELAPGPGAPEATAIVDGWNLEHGTRMLIDVDGLAPSGSDAYYEMWLTAPDGRHVSAGTFRTSGEFEMMAGVRRAEFPRVWVTREPADDDPAPFPDTVLDMPEA